MYTLLYYSATGNTKHLAKELASQLSIEKDKIFELDQTPYEKLKGNDHLVLMYPIHGFNPPRTVKRYIKNLPKGLYKEVSLVAVGCNDLWLNNAVSVNLRKHFIKAGLIIKVDAIIPMPITIVMGMKEEMKAEIIEKAMESIQSIAKDILENQTKYRKVQLASRAVHQMGKLEDVAARLFGLELHAKKGCDSCGICWNRCPENNIKEGKKGLPKFGFSCSMCMRCIYSCPQKVITPRFSKFLTIKDGYTIKK